MNNSTPPTPNNGQSRIDEESAFINAQIKKKQQATQEAVANTLQADWFPLTKTPFVKPNGDISRKY
jgi:hypothetical protein